MVIQCTIFTLQEICCVFWLSQERWYCKSALMSTGAGLRIHILILGSIITFPPDTMENAIFAHLTKNQII